MKECWLVPLEFSAVAQARHEYAMWLRSLLGRDNPLVEYELVFGELVTNAVRHGAAPVKVEAEFRDRRLTLTVEDWGACFDIETPRPARTFAEGGRGIDIVRMLASHLSVKDGANNPCVVVAQMDVPA